MTRRTRLIVLAAVGITIGFGLGISGILPASMPKSDEEMGFAPLAGGEELVFVFIGASTCAWSNVPELPELIREAKAAALERAEETGQHFSAVGISRDRIVDNGVSHLENFGHFDEISTGRGWVNMGVMKYIYGDIPGPAATPQVIVLGRTLHREALQTSIRDEHVILRKVGLDQIKAWVNSGSPF